MAFPQIAWVKNTREATGQDQLGLRFFSETIYQDLIPHITNVTNRGRYYSFYPWLIWAVEQRAADLGNLSLEQIVRRADCLLTLVGLYHYQNVETSDQNAHDGLTGAKKLSVVLTEMLETDEAVSLSRYASRDESPDRYFKNKFGGLGQYYFGPLRDAGILTYNEKGEIHYTEDRGLKIAHAFEKSVSGDLFFEIIKNDRVGETDLELLSSFCPCRLSENLVEQDAVLDFLFSRDEIYQHPVWEKRRQTLLLILDFIEKSNSVNIPVSLDSQGVHGFLSAAYTGAIKRNSLWENKTEASAKTKSFWQQYYAGELLSYAVQGLFWAGITALIETNETVADCRRYGAWFAEKFDDSTGKTFETAAEEIERKLPEMMEFENKSHEIDVVRRLEEAIRNRHLPNRQEAIVGLAVKLLLTLLARWQSSEEKSSAGESFPISFSNQQLNEYPINFPNLLRFAETEWRKLSFNDWLAWLGSRWGVETHLMIALRKLQGESLDTFKVFPAEEGLQINKVIGNKTIEEVLLPGFTSPRLRTSWQILCDLGAVAVKEEALVITPVGEKLLEDYAVG